MRHARPLARTCAAALTLAALLLAPVPAAPQKLKPEELVAKHLDSIGTAAARAAFRIRGAKVPEFQMRIQKFGERAAAAPPAPGGYSPVRKT